MCWSPKSRESTVSFKIRSAKLKLLLLWLVLYSFQLCTLGLPSSPRSTCRSVWSCTPPSSTSSAASARPATSSLSGSFSLFIVVLSYKSVRPATSSLSGSYSLFIVVLSYKSVRPAISSLSGSYIAFFIVFLSYKSVSQCQEFVCFLFPILYTHKK